MRLWIVFKISWRMLTFFFLLFSQTIQFVSNLMSWTTLWRLRPWCQFSFQSLCSTVPASPVWCHPGGVWDLDRDPYRSYFSKPFSVEPGLFYPWEVSPWCHPQSFEGPFSSSLLSAISLALQFGQGLLSSYLAWSKPKYAKLRFDSLHTGTHPLYLVYLGAELWHWRSHCCHLWLSPLSPLLVCLFWSWDTEGPGGVDVLHPADGPLCCPLLSGAFLGGFPVFPCAFPGDGEV